MTKVTLLAQVSQYVSDMEKAGKATRDSADGSTAALDRQRAGFEGVGKASLVMGGLAAAGLGAAVAKFAEFDSAMSEVDASTHESAANMELLRDAAIDAGASTVFSATEAANAIDELAKAGVATADITGGALSGALDLASAGGLGVADAASIAATAMTQFNKTGAEVPHIADLLAAGAGKAQGSVEDLAAALNQGGLVASQAGFSIEETTGTLAAFASAGLIGSDAGTSLKTAILALQNPTDKSRGLMEDYGISVYDAQGKMLGMSEIAGQLEQAFIGKTDAERDSTLATIFGSDAVRAASVLYNQGADGIQEWTDKTNDSGYAADTARRKLDNLKGDVEALGGAFDTALIQTGSAGNEALRGLVQSATFLVDAFNDLPQPAKDATFGVAGVTAAVGLTVGGILTAVPKLVELRDAFQAINVSGRAAGVGLGVASAGVAAATILISTFIQQQAEAKARIDSLKDSLDAQTGAITDSTRATAAKILQDSGALERAKLFGISLDLVTDAALGDKKAMRELGDELDVLQEKHNSGAIKSSMLGGAFESLRQVAAGTNEELVQAQKDHAELQEATEASTDAASEGADAAQQQADALAELSGKAVDATVDINELADAIRGFGAGQLNVNAATRDFEAAIDDLSAAVEKNGASLDITTEQGRENQGALDGIAQSALNASAAILEQTGSQDLASDAISRGREELIRSLEQFGITGAAAEKYADALGLVPGSVLTAVSVTGTDDAMGRIAALRAELVALGNMSVTPNVSPNGVAYSDAREGRADGGTIYGPGTAWSDTAGLYALSTGEEVTSNKYGQADRHRSLLKAINAGASVEDVRSMVAAGRFAEGGTAGRFGSHDPYESAGWSEVYRSQGPRFVGGADSGYGAAAAPQRPAGPSITTIVNPQPRQSEQEIGKAAADWMTIRMRAFG